MTYIYYKTDYIMQPDHFYHTTIDSRTISQSFTEVPAILPMTNCNTSGEIVVGFFQLDDFANCILHWTIRQRCVL